MKKVIFYGLIVFLALFLVTCGGITPSPVGGDTPNVQYSQDGSSVTLRLDGGGTDIIPDRALTSNLAKAGHDYFEVVFYKSATEVARAAWSLGEAAGIKNVPRNFKYGNFTGGGSATTPGDSTDPDTPDASKAIIFVGRSADKTLLAVGRLTAVDGDNNNLFISSTSTTVTFTVAALKTGTSFDPTAATPTFTDSSFVTAPFGTPTGSPSLANTTLKVLTSSKDGTTATFPLYNVPSATPAINAQYTIDNVSSDFSTNYVTGIKIAATLPAIQPKIPRYPKGGGLYFEAPSPHALGTTVTISNNAYAVSPLTAFVPGITFTINTNGSVAADREGAISFNFDIPVLAITNAAPAGVSSPTTWHIRPGFGTNGYDLDNGQGSAGGAILLGVGNTTLLNWLDIITIGP